MAVATASREKDSQRKQPVEFAFDARHKSIVPQVFAEEAKRLKRLFARKPKVSLHQLETALKQKASEAELKKMIPGFVASYFNGGGDAHRYFESLGRLLLEAASKEGEDADYQWYLINQSMEVLRSAMQKAPKLISISAQSMIVSVAKIMGNANYHQYAVEKAVHKEMMTMLNVKRDPNDFGGRERIIKAYLLGKEYYVALVHIAEYEKLMQLKSRSLHRQKLGEIAFRKASVFQMIIDSYYKLSTGKEDENVDKITELSKLNTFVNRFNRDNRRINIVPLKGLDIFALNKTLHSIVGIANNFYGDAARSDQFPGKHKAYFLMARNAFQFENYKGAQQILAEGIRAVEVSRMPQKQKLTEKVRLLEFVHRIYLDLGHQRKADETSAELARTRKEMRGADMAASA